MILDDLLILLDKDESSYPALIIYKNRAITTIKNYLNNGLESAFIELTYEDAIIQLVYNAYTSKGKWNIASESQGSRSISYANNTSSEMTQGIKNLLPLPSVRMMG